MNPNRRCKFKLKVTEYGIKPEDREMILKKHIHLTDLKSKVKALDKSEVEIAKIFRTEMSNVRQDLMDNYAHKFFLATIQLGPHKEEQYFSYYPGIDDINGLKETLTSRLSKDRQSRKKLNKIRKSFNGIEYEMVGGDKGYGLGAMLRDVTIGTYFRPDEPPPPKESKPAKKVFLSSLKGGGNVFTEPGTVLKFLEGEGYANRIYKAKKPYDKSNYVGVEIELICKMDRESLQKEFIEAKLAGNVYIKDDSSIAREDGNEYTHEVTIIGKQQYINDVVFRVCAVLNSKDVGSYVNDSCGIHVHIDMRNRFFPTSFKNLVNTLPILVAMVPQSRTKSKYCVPNISDNNEHDSNQNRRQAINATAFSSHKTVEIRLHSGSTNAIKINNWINILVAIAEKKDGVEFKVTTPEDVQRIFGIDSTLVEYIKRRIDKFKNNTTLNTKDDHFDQSA